MTTSRSTKESAGADSSDSFVEMNFPTAYRFAFCMSLAHKSAADLTQTAFLQAHRARQHPAHAALDKQWLLAALHHEWAARGSRASASVDAESTSLANPPIEPRHVAGLDQAGVLVVLHGMEAKLRLALSLFYFEQLSHREIAEILEIAPEAVLAHLAEAKTVLRRELEGNRKDAEPTGPLEAKGRLGG